MKFVISGPERERYAGAVRVLLEGRLPSGWEWVDSAANSIVARRLEPQRVYYKEFLRRSPFEPVKSLLRGSRCQRAIRNGEVLRESGFHAPVVCCWGKMGGRHFMITEGIEALGLGNYIGRRWQQPQSDSQFLAKRRFFQKFGKKIGELHKKGICHGDLRVNNVLVRESEDNIMFYFVDNERNAFFRKIPMRLVRKNLVQLNMIQSPHVSRQDRLRFFQAYCETYGRFRAAEIPILIERVHRRTTERLAKKAEKERQVGK